MRSRSAFTLIELLVVITIIGILVTVVSVSFDNARQKGRDSRRKQDLQAVKSALVLYYGDFRQFPPSCQGSSCQALSFSSSAGSNWIPELEDYIQKLPKDPKQTKLPVFLAFFKDFFGRLLIGPKSANAQGTVDYQITTIVFDTPGPYYQGQLVDFHFTLKNNGSADNGEGVMQAYVNRSTKPACNTNPGPPPDGDAGSYSGQWVVAGGTVTYSGPFPVPTTNGTYTLGIFADFSCIVNESVESNNWLTKSYSVSAPAPTPTPTPTPTPSPSPPPPSPVASPSPSPAAAPDCANLKFIYCYAVSADRRTFVLWAQLENSKNQEIFNKPNATCNLTPPNTFFNYCLQSPQ